MVISGGLDGLGAELTTTQWRCRTATALPTCLRHPGAPTTNRGGRRRDRHAKAQRTPWPTAAPSSARTNIVRRADVELSVASWSHPSDGRLVNTRWGSISSRSVREASTMSQRRSWPSPAEIRRDDGMEAADLAMAGGYGCGEQTSRRPPQSWLSGSSLIRLYRMRVSFPMNTTQPLDPASSSHSSSRMVSSLGIP